MIQAGLDQFPISDRDDLAEEAVVRIFVAMSVASPSGELLPDAAPCEEGDRPRVDVDREVIELVVDTLQNFDPDYESYENCAARMFKSMKSAYKR